MRNYTLTITKAINKVKLMLALRKYWGPISIPEAKQIVDNLPFITEWCYTPANMYEVLDKIAEYTYQPVPLSSEEEKELIRQEELSDALAWYHSLPIQDKRRVDILMRGNTPMAI